MKRLLMFLPAGFCLAASAFAFEVKSVAERPRYTRGDTNVRVQAPIDQAAWIWMPDSDVWGDAANCDAWNFRFGFETRASHFFRFRNRFDSDGSPLRFDVSADERFVLYLDGEPIARGPQRGMVEHWYYQSYEITGLSTGTHTLEAVCWQLGIHAPLAQLSLRGGFILCAHGAYDAALTTGKAAWKVARLVGTTMTDRGTSKTFGAGSQCRVVGTGYPNERPAANEWRDAAVVRAGVMPNPYGGRTNGWMLCPADRPDQMHEVSHPGRIVNVDHDLAKSFVVPANSERDLWWDLDNYYCAYPELETSGGKGAVVTWGWTESLLHPDGKKGNRDEWRGKEFSQTMTDTFICDGRADAHFTSPWWRCGRWCRVTVKTADEPLTVRRLAIAETRYPLAVDASFASDDATLGPVLGISRRAMEMCMHEMLFDCPYYEQQMYPGDTRVQLQVINALTRDDRMTRFVLSIYDFSRRSDGAIAMNFPTRGTQESFTYSLCWAMMFKDYLYWHDDAAFLRLRMPGVRNTLMGLAVYENAEGLLENLPGWSFMDWVTGDQPFKTGVAPDGDVGQGVSALNNLQYLLALQSVAAVDAALGEDLLAAHWNRKAERLTRALFARFFDEGRGILADTDTRRVGALADAHETKRFSEHAQCMAIIAGILSPEQRKAALDALVKGEGLAPVSSYFAYYLFEAFVKCGRADLVMKRFDYWRTFVKNGARTAYETQDPDSTRSDCHAWSACPVYFVQTALAGVTPSSPFFKKVRVAPQPSGLKEIRAKTPCPQGLIETDLRFAGEDVAGTVTLPAGLTGEFVWRDRILPLAPGRNEIPRFEAYGRRLSR